MNRIPSVLASFQTPFVPGAPVAFEPHPGLDEASCDNKQVWREVAERM